MRADRATLGLFLAAVVLLPGCRSKVATYHRKPLENVRADKISYYGIENDVAVQAKRLNKEEVCNLFGQSCNAFEVIYFSVTNEGDLYYTLFPEDIDLVVTPYQDVARSMKTSSEGRFVEALAGMGGAAGASVLWAHALSSLKWPKCNDTKPLLIAGIYILPSIAIASAVIGFICLGRSFKSMVMNGRISRDVKRKTLHKKVTIKPGGYHEWLLFVKPLDYNPHFTITIHEKYDIDTKIVFDVDVQQVSNS